MKKKGFTLIELLAVIVILAIIVLVAMPILSGIMTNVKIKSLKNSGYGIMEASNLYHAMYSNNKTVRFDIKDDKITSDETNKIKYSGSIKEGTVLIDKKGNVALCLKDGNNSVYKNFTEKDIIEAPKGVCSFESGSYIVYLNGVATINELDNQALTAEVENLKAEIASLKSLKANQSDLDSTNSNLETVATLASNAATKSELNAVNNKIYTPIDISIAKEYISTSGVLAYRNASVTIPADSFYSLTARVGWNYGKPYTLILAGSSTDATDNLCDSVAIDEDDRLSCTVSGYASSPLTFYFWSKHDSDGLNTAYINGWYFKK